MIEASDAPGAAEGPAVAGVVRREGPVPYRSPVAWLGVFAVVLVAILVAGTVVGRDDDPATGVGDLGSAADPAPATETSSSAPDRTVAERATPSSGWQDRPGGDEPGDAGPEGTDATEAGMGDVLPVGSGWVLVLHSTEKALGIDEARTNAARFLGPNIAVVDSDAYVGMTPGYWAVVSYGYGSEDDARADCAVTFGLPLGGACYARQIG